MTPRRSVALVMALAIGALLAWLLWPRTWTPRFAPPVMHPPEGSNITPPVDRGAPGPHPPRAASVAAWEASGSHAEATARLAEMHRLDQAHCNAIARPWDALKALLNSANPPDSVASLPAPLRKEAEGLEAQMTGAAHRALALRLAQLDARPDDFSRGVALWLRGQQRQLPALALRSPDVRLLRLAFRQGCEARDETCRQPLRAQWLRLQPDNAAAWLAQWERFDRPDPSRSADDHDRQKDALLAGMAQSRFFDDGFHDVARLVLSGPGPAANGLHAAAEEIDWIGRAAAQSLPSMAGWVGHCKLPQAAWGSPRAIACLASAEALWRTEPATLLQATVSLAVVTRLGAGDQAPWTARQQRLDALWRMQDRSFGPYIEHMMSSMACKPDAAMQTYFLQLRMEGEVLALREAIRRQGLDEAQLAAEYRATRPKAASAPG